MALEAEVIGNVAIGVKNSKRSIAALKWALENLVQEGDCLTLLHVQHPVHYVPSPVGNLAVGQVSEEKVKAYKARLQGEIDGFVSEFKALCVARKVKAEYVQVEGESIQKALVSSTGVLSITTLVLGGSGNKGIRKLSGPKIVSYVSKHAPPQCTVLVISKNKVISRKRNEESGSFSSSASQYSASETSDLYNLSSGSSSQEVESPSPIKAVGRLSTLPDGLLFRTRKLAKLLSFRSLNLSRESIPPEGIRGARIFSTPFEEDVLTSNLNIGESGSESFSSSGTKSINSSASENNSASETRKPGLSPLSAVTTHRKTLRDELSSTLDHLDLSNEEPADTAAEDFEPPRNSTRRKSVHELTLLSQKTFREYQFSDLEAATNNFDEKLKLGEGGYGWVYKGKLHGQEVAIKVLKKESFQRTQEFQREVELLGRIQHPHMVALLGCCSERGCLVYEHMAKGSVDDRLFCKGGTAPLPWYTRFRIAAEVAGALHFLHNLGSEPIVHRDLKPANVLLDHNFVSKVGDVGLARLVPERLAAMNSTYFRDTTPVGTFAYIDPEYQRTGTFGPKSDVYALGIVVLQLLTGKPPVGVHAIVEEAIECGNFTNILDQSAGEWPVEKAEEVACLALQCAEMRRRQRPNLEAVLPLLDNARSYAENYAAISATKRALSQESRLTVPSIFFCPLGRQVMEEPVVAADGYTYEYQAIRQWFQAHDTSPQTCGKLEHKQLTPNYALHKLISEWKSRNRQ